MAVDEMPVTERSGAVEDARQRMLQATLKFAWHAFDAQFHLWAGMTLDEQVA